MPASSEVADNKSIASESVAESSFSFTSSSKEATSCDGAEALFTTASDKSITIKHIDDNNDNSEATENDNSDGDDDDSSVATTSTTSSTEKKRYLWNVFVRNFDRKHPFPYYERCVCCGKIS